MRIPVDPRLTYRLINHGPVTLLTTRDQRRTNVMAAAWVMPLRVDPPRIVLMVDTDSFTHELLEASGELVVNLPTRAMLDATYAAGRCSGRQLDKIEKLGFRTTPAAHVAAPLLDGCVGWLECRLVYDPELLRRYGLRVADVLAAWADDEVFVHERWRFRDEDRRTVHHLSGYAFFVTGDYVEAREPNPTAKLGG